mgnify:CR=1 FL=1
MIKGRANTARKRRSHYEQDEQRNKKTSEAVARAFLHISLLSFLPSCSFLLSSLPSFQVPSFHPSFLRCSASRCMMQHHGCPVRSQATRALPLLPAAAGRTLSTPGPAWRRLPPRHNTCSHRLALWFCFCLVKKAPWRGLECPGVQMMQYRGLRMARLEMRRRRRRRHNRCWQRGGLVPLTPRHPSWRPSSTLVRAAAMARRAACCPVFRLCVYVGGCFVVFFLLLFSSSFSSSPPFSHCFICLLC